MKKIVLFIYYFVYKKENDFYIYEVSIKNGINFLR